MKKILALVQFVPAILASVKAVEEAMPDKGNGSTKLQLVLALIETGIAGATDLVAAFAELRPNIEAFIGKLVGIWNAIGVFKKG